MHPTDRQADRTWQRRDGYQEDMVGETEKRREKEREREGEGQRRIERRRKRQREMPGYLSFTPCHQLRLYHGQRKLLYI